MKEKSENRKALPKFFLTIAGSLLVGGALGFVVGLSRFFDLETASLAAGLDEIIRTITPWAIPATTLVILGSAFLAYRAAAKKYAVWGGEDEDDTAEAVDQLLSWVLLLSGVQLLIDFFFLAAVAVYDVEESALFIVAMFIVSCALVIFAQQKTVDLLKRMNPEKRGSVYDMKFQKKWYNSMDESERQQTGQACYRAYMVTTHFCMLLWLVLVILSMIIDISLLPIFIVLLIWGVMQVTYVLECMRLSKKQSA